LQANGLKSDELGGVPRRKQVVEAKRPVVAIAINEGSGK
jgi:hypothetical protein